MFKYLILAIIQALTEFLPVSSSAHLVIFDRWFNSGAGLFYYLVLHLGTVLALMVFFSREITRVLKTPPVLKKIAIVTFVTGILGFLGKDFFEGLFLNPRLLSLSLLINGLILLSANLRINNPPRPLTYRDSFILGFIQAIAIIPGLSRSGLTISLLLFRRIDRETAFKFSFLSAIPIIILAFLYKTKEVSFCFSLPFSYYFWGFSVSFLGGLGALFILSLFIRKSRLDIFGYYCLGVSLVNFFLSR